MKTKEELKRELESVIEFVKELARVSKFSEEWTQFHIEEAKQRYGRWINEAKK